MRRGYFLVNTYIFQYLITDLHLKSSFVLTFQGNDIRLLHFLEEEITEYETESSAESYSIDIHEDFWMRNDRQLIDREHLLMALANVDFVLIRATDPAAATLETG